MRIHIQWAGSPSLSTSALWHWYQCPFHWYQCMWYQWTSQGTDVSGWSTNFSCTDNRSTDISGQEHWFQWYWTSSHWYQWVLGTDFSGNEHRRTDISEQWALISLYSQSLHWYQWAVCNDFCGKDIIVALNRKLKEKNILEDTFTLCLEKRLSQFKLGKGSFLNHEKKKKVLTERHFVLAVRLFFML